jgi:hypothetical protein
MVCESITATPTRQAIVAALYAQSVTKGELTAGLLITAHRVMSK